MQLIFLKIGWNNLRFFEKKLIYQMKNNCEKDNERSPFLQFFFLSEQANEKLNNMFCRNIKAAIIKRYKNNWISSGIYYRSIIEI